MYTHSLSAVGIAFCDTKVTTMIGYSARTVLQQIVCQENKLLFCFALPSLTSHTGLLYICNHEIDRVSTEQKHYQEPRYTKKKKQSQRSRTWYFGLIVQLPNDL